MDWTFLKQAELHKTAEPEWDDDAKKIAGLLMNAYDQGARYGVEDASTYPGEDGDAWSARYKADHKEAIREL